MMLFVCIFVNKNKNWQVVNVAAIQSKFSYCIDMKKFYYGKTLTF